MKHSFIIYTFLIVASVLCAQAQEVMVPLSNNPIKQHESSNIRAEKSATKGTTQVLTLTLPFWDDFSYQGPYPDIRLWTDNYVFINNSYAVHPKTIGVATFDALDATGNLYEDITASNSPYVADLLSTHYIRLDSVFAPVPRPLTPADSVILSFYYQPQGTAGDPIRQDSLVVEFLHSPGRFIIDDEGELIWIEDVWRSVWKTDGMSLQAFAQDTFPFFKRATITITDPVYFRKDFRFRFKNHVSFPLAGNPTLQNNGGMRSVWNIDYVFLNSNRSANNRNYFDIAFAAPPQSILKDYTKMPWAHFIANPQQQLRQSFSMKITNLDNATYPYSYRYIIRDEAGNSFRNYSGGTWNIAPFANNGYQQYQPHASPIVIANPLPTAPAAERHFDIVHIIRAGTAGDSRQRNDTVVHRQSFRDFFAYDDGVPEAGYGVLGRFPKMANKYVVSKPDLLTHVDILFTKNLGEGNLDRPFKLSVWKRIGPDEEMLYQSEDPIFSRYGDGINEFVRFELSRSVQLTDTFYVGIEQQGFNIGINEFISIGFDTSNNAGSKIFYTLYEDWVPSIKKGALMIRPVFDSQKTITDIREPGKNDNTLVLSPNPLSDQILHIRIGETPEHIIPGRMDIIDMFGKLIYSGSYRQTYNAGHLPNGTYFLRIIYQGEKAPETKPFIIAR